MKPLAQFLSELIVDCTTWPHDRRQRHASQELVEQRKLNYAAARAVLATSVFSVAAVIVLISVWFYAGGAATIWNLATTGTTWLLMVVWILQLGNWPPRIFASLPRQAPGNS